MHELDLARRTTLPRHRADRRVRLSTFGVTVVLHALLLIGVLWVQRGDVGRVVADSPRQDGSGVFVNPAPRPLGTTGIARPKPRPVRAAPRPPTPAPSSPATSDIDAAASAAPAGVGAPQASAPVRLAPGQGVRLLRKIEPVYPIEMRYAGTEGVVVLDAVIHRDGTIGEVTVLRSSNPAFERAAIEAVKQWRYTPLPYEGIVTVTITFSLQKP